MKIEIMNMFFFINELLVKDCNFKENNILMNLIYFFIVLSRVV